MVTQDALFGTARLRPRGVRFVAKEMAMSQATLTDEPREEGKSVHEAREPGLVLGRPIEDRSFEMVETGIGVAAGLAIGTAVAGPVGTVVGGLVGAAAGIVAGEAVERAVGPAAETTDVGGPEEPEPEPHEA
jgi:outer membrane lipoprotein SlyB